MGLPSIAVKRPVMTSMLFIALVMLGTIALARLPVELYQGQNQGIISIIVRARGGLAPIEVEKTITIPIEESVATVGHLKNLYSHSREAESRVTMEFEPGANMKYISTEVREKFSRVLPLLPKQIEKPVIANYDDAEAAVLVFALTSETLSPEEIREMVERELKPYVMRVDGVASMEIYGGRERKILVEMDRDKMVHYNISIERVMDILGQSNINLLAGNVDKGKLELAVRSMGAFETVEEIGGLGIKATRQGSIIPLKEIGTVKDSYLEPTDHARLNLEQNVTVYVKKTSTAKTIPVVKAVRSMLDGYKKLHHGAFDIVIVTDKAKTISSAIGDVTNALVIGMFLTVGVIYLFLRRWKLAAVVFLSIPCSVITTFLLMYLFNISINVMTMSGLALSIGILVDSSIVIIENVFSKKEQRVPDLPAIREGAEEMWLPLLASLITTLIVFLPIIFIDKKIQMTYAGFAFTVCVSLLASFFVAQMLVPMVMKQWAMGSLEPVPGDQKGFSAKAPAFYESLLRKNLKKKYLVVFILLAVFALSLWGLTSRAIDWPTTYQENEFSVIVFPLAGAKLEANDEAIKKIEDLLDKIPDIDIFSTTVRKDDIRIFVRLKPKAKRKYSKDEIMKLLDEKGNEMIKQIHDDYSLIIDEGVSASEQKKLVVNIFGHDNDTLQKLAIEAANGMSKIPGLHNLVMTDLRKRPEYSLIVDKGRAAVYGLNVQAIADSIHAQVRGMRPTKYHELSRGEEIETITRLQAIYRQKVEDLALIHIETEAGKQVPLGEIANFYPSTGPQTIDRKDKYRYVFIKGDVKRPIETIAKESEKILREMKFPDDYYWRFGGAYEELMQSKGELTVALILTLFLVYMVLGCLFQSYIEPLLVMISVPLAVIGIYLGLWITRTPLSQQVFIGMILLAGYVVNSAIILMDHMNHFVAKGMPHEEAVIRACLDRLRPICMTTASTVLGFLPLALGWSESSELWRPLSITVIGGLLSSTFLTLFVLPNFVLIVEENKQRIREFFSRLAFYPFRHSV